MSFFVGDPGLIVSHLLYKTAVVSAVLRWGLSWALNLRFIDINCFFTAATSSDSQHNSPSSSSSLVSSDMIRDNLVPTTFGDAKERMPWVSDTCQLKEDDHVRELRNCCHVFHKDCIDRWVDYDQDHDDEDDNHKTCPLCRAPLLASSQSLVGPNNGPSWAVDQLVYLFGDAFLP